jgi:2-octaprenyl-6-methoxyphenol hydroxylase
LPHDDVSTEFHTGAGPFTLVPLPGQRSSLVWVNTGDEAERLRQLSPAALAGEIERETYSILGTIADVEPAQVFRLAAGSAARLASNRIALVGESAHVLPPIAAQGFNLTVRDIALLAELVDGSADPGGVDLLDEYDRRRRPDLSARSLAVGLLNRSLVSRSPVAQLARSAGLYALGMVPALRRSLIRQGLGIR